MDKHKKVKVGAADVTFGEARDPSFKSDHHVFDAELPRDVQSEDELYGAPPREPISEEGVCLGDLDRLATRKLSPEEGNYFPRDKGFGLKGTNPDQRQAEQTLATVVNILSSIDALEADTSVTNARDGKDMVVMPNHYARFAIEPIRFVVENNLNFLQGNIIKYVLRFDAKNGMEDLEKATRYLTMLKRFVAKDPDWWRK